MGQTVNNMYKSLCCMESIVVTKFGVMVGPVVTILEDVVRGDAFMVRHQRRWCDGWM